LDSRTQGTKGPRARKETSTAGGRGTDRAGSLEHVVQQESPQEPEAGPGNPGKNEARCTVDGQPVSELFCLIIGPPAFLITKEGSHEMTRVFYAEDDNTKKVCFNLGFGPDRAGSGSGSPRVKSAAYEPEGRGLTLMMDSGHVCRISAGRIQATWRV
jgi:hypothetical protein